MADIERPAALRPLRDAQDVLIKRRRTALENLAALSTDAIADRQTEVGNLQRQLVANTAIINELRQRLVDFERIGAGADAGDICLTYRTQVAELASSINEAINALKNDYVIINDMLGLYNNGVWCRLFAALNATIDVNLANQNYDDLRRYFNDNCRFDAQTNTGTIMQLSYPIETMQILVFGKTSRIYTLVHDALDEYLPMVERYIPPQKAQIFGLVEQLRAVVLDVANIQDEIAPRGNDNNNITLPNLNQLSDNVEILRDSGLDIIDQIEAFFAANPFQVNRGGVAQPNPVNRVADVVNEMEYENHEGNEPDVNQVAENAAEIAAANVRENSFQHSGIRSLEFT